MEKSKDLNVADHYILSDTEYYVTVYVISKLTFTVVKLGHVVFVDLDIAMSFACAQLRLYGGFTSDTTTPAHCCCQHLTSNKA